MIRIKYVPNRMSPSGRIEKIMLFDRAFSVGDYIKRLEGVPAVTLKDFDIIVSGRTVKTLKEYVKNHDEIIITPKVDDPVSVGTFFATVVTAMGASAEVAATVMTIAMIATIAADIAMLGYSIYSAINQPSMPSFGGLSVGGLDEGSPTYGWEGVRTTRDASLPVPIVYGEHKVGGNVINEYVWTDGDKNYLNTLLALSEGEIESISEIKINDNPIANYEGVTQATRMGTNAQALIPNFEDLHNTIPVNVQLLKDNPYIHTTIDEDVEAFEVKLQLPSGLSSIDTTTGESQSWSVTYRVEYKLSSSGTWIDLGLTTISGNSRSVLRRVFRKDGLAAGRYDIRVTKTSEDPTSNQNGALYFQSIDEVKTDDMIYPNTALLGIRTLATEQISGASPNYSVIVRGRKVSVPDVQYGGNPVAWSNYYWDPATSEYKLLADDSVCTWDGVTYIDAWSANPIWCLRDLLTNTRYGLGDFISASQIDSGLMLEMSRYCDEKVPDGSGGYEKRFRMDVAIDSATKALDLILQLASTFNAFPFYSAGSIKFSVDKPTTPVQMFGMGNIIADSFQQIWSSVKDMPNVIEVQFLDKAKDYEQETVAIIDEASLAAGEPMRKRSIRLFTTSMTQALRVGRYALKVAQNINRVVSFKAGIDAIACQVGDIIDVAHDVPQWGFSGRVQANSTTTLIKLDQTVVIESGKSYKIELRLADDTIVERSVTDAAGIYTEVTVSPALSSAPAAYDVYAFGEVDIQTKPFRVVSIARDERDEVEITAAEYDEAVYDDTAVTIPTNNYSALNRSIPLVADVVAVEKNVILKDGTIGSVIQIGFTKPEQISYYLKRYEKARVYLSDNAGASWQCCGETSGTSFVVTEGLIAGNTYKIAVVSVSPEGAQNAITLAPQATVTILGKALPPSNVTNFDVSQQGDSLHFTWAPVDDKDLARYIIKKGSEWAVGDIIAEKIDVTEFDFPVGIIGEETYMIKAIDTSGNESVAAALDTIIVTPPPEMSFAVEIDPWAFNREYKLDKVAVEKLNLFNPGYARDVFCLTTAQKWEDIEGSAEGWDQKEADGDLNFDKVFEASGSWEQVEPYDLQTIFEFKLVTSLQFRSVSGGTITVQVSTSEDGTTYTAFANVNAGTNYRARYLKFKFLLATSDTDHNLYWYSATIFANAATTKTDFGRDILVAAGGTAVVFRGDFTSAPRITGLTIKNGVLGIPYVSDVTVSGMTIHVANLSGAGIGTAEVDWEVRGS